MFTLPVECWSQQARAAATALQYSLAERNTEGDTYRVVRPSRWEKSPRGIAVSRFLFSRTLSSPVTLENVSLARLSMSLLVRTLQRKQTEDDDWLVPQ